MASTTAEFSAQAKRFFLTYPQCPIGKQTLLEHLVSLEASSVLVSEEQHKDGHPHLHAYVQFAKAKRVKTRFFDLADFHPNIEVVKNMKKVIEYVTKDDKEPAQHQFDYKAVLAGKSSKMGIVARLFIEGKSLSEVNELEPGLVLMHKRKMEEYVSWLVRKKPRILEPWVPLDMTKIINFGPEYELATWLNANIHKPRVHKQPQLFLWSPPNCGKTTLVEWLSRFCRVYYMPLGENFDDEYEDDCYDLAVVDEFKGQRAIQFLNQFLDGQPMPIRVKGGQRLKRNNLPTIILSNYPLYECYSKAYELNKHCIDPLVARLELVNLQKFITFLPPK